MNSCCCVDAAGNVSRVMRSVAWDSVRIIGQRCGLPNSNDVLVNVVVISRRYVVC